jgi:hypothetical protein
MTPAVLDRPASLFDRAADAPCEGHETRPGGSRVTLEERLTAALHGVRTDGSTECPVCCAPMTAEPGGARCTGCGSRLR